WGPSARASYEAMIDLVTRAEEYLARKSSGRPTVAVPGRLETALARVRAVAPVLRGALAAPTGDPDRRHRRVIVLPLVTPEVLDFVDGDGGRAAALTPPLTSDHLIRTKAFPLWIDSPSYQDQAALAEQIRAGVRRYVADYRAYLERHTSRLGHGVGRLDALPRVVLLPGLGALCAAPDLRAAAIARDITAHTLAVKTQGGAIGTYEGLPEAELFAMEYHNLQRGKRGARGPALEGAVGVVTGAAGAIGSGLCRALLEQGCTVAATDLPGKALDGLVAELAETFGPRVMAVPLDVTDTASVAEAFGTVAATGGGGDLVVVNAGVGHGAGRADLGLDALPRPERGNVGGTPTRIA